MVRIDGVNLKLKCIKMMVIICINVIIMNFFTTSILFYRTKIQTFVEYN